jgi:hypothetical protein
MHGVIDTNQASRLPYQYKFTGRNQVRKQITLAPCVFGEILLRTNPHPTLEHLNEFDIRFGLEIGETIESISHLSEEQVLKFKPFVNPEFSTHYGNFYSGLSSPSVKHKTWAQNMKQNHQEFCDDMARRSILVRNQLQGRGVRVERFRRLDDALNQLPSFQELVVTSVTNGGQRESQIADAATLYRAVMGNPFLSRMWKSILFFLVSWARQWQEQRLNFDPSPDRDDWVDMTLPLYAAQGDVILTADAKLKMMIAAVEPTGSVTTGNANEF